MHNFAANSSSLQKKKPNNPAMKHLSLTHLAIGVVSLVLFFKAVSHLSEANVVVQEAARVVHTIKCAQPDTVIIRDTVTVWRTRRVFIPKVCPDTAKIKQYGFILPVPLTPFTSKRLSTDTFMFGLCIKPTNFNKGLNKSLITTTPETIGLQPANMYSVNSGSSGSSGSTEFSSQ